MPKSPNFLKDYAGLILGEHPGKTQHAAQAEIDRLLAEHVDPDTARLFQQVVRLLRKELSHLEPFDQLNAVTTIVSMLFKVSSASTAYANQPNLTRDDLEKEELPPKQTLVEIMEERLKSIT